MKAQLFINGQLISGEAYVEAEFSKFETELDPIFNCYEGTVTLENLQVDEIKEDDRIKSNVLNKYFKGIALDYRVYQKISKSLDRLERVTK